MKPGRGQERKTDSFSRCKQQEFYRENASIHCRCDRFRLGLKGKSIQFDPRRHAERHESDHSSTPPTFQFFLGTPIDLSRVRQARRSKHIASDEFVNRFFGALFR